ncbi:MAG: Vitamin B12 import ATP-binding protein BtuD [Turneriella sp.]|nr:Vitamin B12 import ATP-binding protein BtuD [Turneriella sp.]
MLSRDKLTVKALNNISLTIGEKEIVGLVGESGSGKSTLARIVMGLYKPDTGYFTFDGIDSRTMTKNDWKQLRQNLGVVFQDPVSSMNPWMSVEKIVSEPMVIRKRKERIPKKQRRDRVVEILEATGLSSNDLVKKIHEFSGGQRQRIAIARALVLKPKYLILDEPISALDVSIQAQILNLLMDLRKQYGFAAIFITHDLSIVRWFSDRIAVMYLGHIVETARADVIFEKSRHPYTKALALSKLDTDVHRREFYTLPGEIPSPVNAPPGCPFEPRCTRAVPECTKAFPLATHISDGTLFHCYNPLEVE